MTIQELYDRVREIYEQYRGKYPFIGLRFEDKQRELGEFCEWSKSNHEREDEREFPEYGTPEYDQLEDMGGTSAWDLQPHWWWTYTPGCDYSPREYEEYKDYDVHRLLPPKHCYVVAGYERSRKDMPQDHGEIVIEDARVIAILY